jgi:collagen type III alpha
VRHNPASPEYDEIPLEQGETARLWTLRVPQSVIQNGFWYKVAAGDAVTTEYRVTVRSKPLVKEVEVRYEYPPYTRLKPETATDRNIDGYRGTKITLTAKTNRQVKRGWMQFDGQQDSIPGEVVGENKDSMRFTFILSENGAYRLGFTPVDGEPSEPTTAYSIRIVVDQAPRPEITSPIEDQA